MIKNKGNNPKVSVIIVNWNGRNWLKESMGSLMNQDYHNFEVVVVDNGSTDDSIRFLQDNYSDKVKIVENGENFGFGKANNIGAKKSDGELLLFLNNDTKFSSNLLNKLVDDKISRGLNVIGPRILDEQGVDLLDSRYLGMDFLGSPGGPVDRMFYVDGCSLLISKDDFDRLGGFDEAYFMYGEDIDLCWRARLFGMSLGICEGSKLVHYGGGSSEKTNNSKSHVVPVWRRYEVEKNTMCSILKNYQSWNLLWVIPVFVVQNFSESLVYLITGNRQAAGAVANAFRWNIRNIRSILRQRRVVQNKRVVGDCKIMKSLTFFPNKLVAFYRIGIPKFK